MADILILLSHPDYARSRANRALASAAASLPGVEIAHLEALYPEGDLDPDTEVDRLLAARRIVLQFPVQWYSTPPWLKLWQDTVLTRMFYLHPQTEGSLLAGRPLMVTATAGNQRDAYAPTGANLFPLAALLHPLQATAHRCGLHWTEPFLLYQNKAVSDGDLAALALEYVERLRLLDRSG